MGAGRDDEGAAAVVRTGAGGSDRFAAIFRNLPAGVAVLHGEDYVFEFVNDLYVQLVGPRDFIGVPVRRAFPEVEGQGFFELLDEVYATGEPFVGRETPIMLDRSGTGELEQSFLDFVYLATRDESGEVDGILAHVVDVTDLVRSRQQVEALARELESERSRLATVVEQAPAGVVIGEAPSGRLTLANRAWRDLFGVPIEEVEEIASYAVFTGFHADGSEYRPDEYPLARSVATGEVIVGEQIEFAYRDGSRGTIQINSAPIRDADGAITAGVAAFFDVTDRRRAETMLEGHKQVLELIAAGAPLADALDALVRMIEENAGHELLGSILLLDRDGKHLRHGAAPNLSDSYNEAIDGIEIGPSAGSCGTAAFTGERVIVNDIDTDPLWADFRELALDHGLRACWSTPILSTQGDVLGTFAMYYTEARAPRPEDAELVEIVRRTAAVAIERKRLEEERLELLERERSARLEAERRAQAALSLAHVADGVCLLDRDDRVQLWNPAAEQILGIDADAIVGRPIVEFLPGWGTVLEQSGQAVTTIPVEPRGQELWLSISSVSFPDGNVFAFRDVTAEHVLEELRADLVATVSHELRTPLAAVYGAAMTLQRLDLVSGQAPQLVQMIGVEAERLRLLIDEILLASQLEAGTEVRVEIARIESRELARSVVAAALPEAAGQAIQLELPDDPAYVEADEQRVRQVLANLVDNALKYGANGDPVTVKVEPAGRSIRFSVVDRGAGIPRQLQERIFEKFYRLDPELLQGVSGTGLGLYICRELVERMHGRIWVDSVEGRGATFAFELPRPR